MAPYCKTEEVITRVSIFTSPSHPACVPTKTTKRAEEKLHEPIIEPETRNGGAVRSSSLSLAIRSNANRHSEKEQPGPHTIQETNETIVSFPSFSREIPSKAITQSHEKQLNPPTKQETNDTIVSFPSFLQSSQSRTKKQIEEKQIEVAANFLIHHIAEPAKNTRKTHKLPSSKESISVFFSIQPASMGVAMYVERLIQYTKCSKSVIIYAMIYLRRIEEAECRLYISAYTMHRLFITSIMIASKFIDEAYYSNSYYARVGGIASLSEMNRLELEFLRILNFRTYVALDEFEEMVDFGMKGSMGATIFSTRLRIARL